jgi:ribosome-binding factor A
MKRLFVSTNSCTESLFLHLFRRKQLLWVLMLIFRSDAFTWRLFEGKSSQNTQIWKRRISPLILSAYTSPVGAGRSYSRRNGQSTGDMKSKRQERVGQLVRTELSQIIHSGLIKGVNVEHLDDELRTRISVVSTDVSPDLRQARVSVSVRPVPASIGTSGVDESTEVNVAPDASILESVTIPRRTSPAVDRRRAYSWLVRNTKPIRFTLAQKLSHMKSCPDLTFVQVDVSAAVDVMYLIDKLSSTNGNYKRESLDLFDADEVTRGVVGGLDFDATDDDEEWDDEDDGDFFNA